MKREGRHQAVSKNAWLKRVVKVAAVLCACFVFWLFTAPAEMAIERSLSGTGFIFVITTGTFRWYASPMVHVNKFPILKRTTDYLEDAWCQVLDAPETTPGP